MNSRVDEQEIKKSSYLIAKYQAYYSIYFQYLKKSILISLNLNRFQLIKVKKVVIIKFLFLKICSFNTEEKTIKFGFLLSLFEVVMEFVVSHPFLKNSPLKNFQKQYFILKQCHQQDLILIIIRFKIVIGTLIDRCSFVFILLEIL